MAIRLTTSRKATAIAKKQAAIRDHHWPCAEDYLWDRRAHRGFATIPKTMPMILKIMDEMTKGTPVSSTYLSLWCSTWDNSFVNLNYQRELAVNSGFSGQRRENDSLNLIRIGSHSEIF